MNEHHFKGHSNHVKSLMELKTLVERGDITTKRVLVLLIDIVIDMRRFFDQSIERGL